MPPQPLTMKYNSKDYLLSIDWSCLSQAAPHYHFAAFVY